MQAIAVRAGVDRATVYRHFASREELLRAVYLEYTELFTQIIETLKPKASDQAAELQRVTLELLALADHWRPFRYAAPFPQDVDEHRVRMVESLLPLMTSGQKSGAFRSDFEPLELVIAWGTPFPYASVRLSEGGWSRDEAADFILKLIKPCH